MHMSPACEMPAQARITPLEKQHPRYAEYAKYRATLAAQLVVAPPFSAWLHHAEQEANYRAVLFRVIDSNAELKPGYYANLFDPGCVLVATIGPFESESMATYVAVREGYDPD